MGLYPACCGARWHRDILNGLGVKGELKGDMYSFYTVSMKLRSVRLKMMTERKRVTSMKMVL